MFSDYKGQSVLDFSPATRNQHPKTSQIAERLMNKTGTRKMHCEIIFAVLKRYNGSTTAEIAGHCELTEEQVHKRMADLVENRLIVRGNKDTCSVKKTMCSRWWIRI